MALGGAGVSGAGVSGAGVSGSGILSGGNVLDSLYGTTAFLFDIPSAQFKNGLNGGVYNSFASLNGLTFTRASVGYAQTSAGGLVQFASGAPRITDKGLLIEGARTNLCLQSQAFDNASWGKNQGTITADAAAAPDGTQTADLFVPNTSSAAHSLTQAITHTVASYTNSVFYKPAGYTKIGIRENTSSGQYACFDCSGAGSVINTNSTAFIQALANGWYRIGITWTGAAVSQTMGIYVLDNAYTTGSPHSYNYSGDGISGGYVWGAQDELGAFPSSYTPTTTTSQARAADVASIAVSGLAYPITLFAEFERVVDTGGVEAQLALDNGATTDQSLLYVAPNDRARGEITSVAGGGQQAVPSIASTLSVGVAYRTAMRVDTDNVILALAGSLSSLDSSCVNPATPTTVRLATIAAVSSPSFGYLRRAAIFPTAFSDAQLQAVST